MFQSQGRFFGGSNCVSVKYVPVEGIVSFNRRGDSLGGATCIAGPMAISSKGSFQSQGRFFGGSNINPPDACPSEYRFNRRGDSLGEQRQSADMPSCDNIMFQSQGRFFGGSNRAGWLKARPECQCVNGFNRRGDSLGGATRHPLKASLPRYRFQSQGRFFGGATL